MDHDIFGDQTAPEATPVTNDSSTTPSSPDTSLSHRDRVAKEILTSERTYVENMVVLIEVFLLPLRQSGDISSNHLTAMFANIEEIVPINKELLSSLETRINDWSQTQRIGDVMLNLTPYLKMYTKYTAGYDAALTAVTECEKNSTFRDFLLKCHENPQCKALNLRSFLIQPVQRIPRYNMLLEDLIKNTDKTHPDYDDLRSALGKMKVVANDINEAIRVSENRSKVLAIQKSFTSEIELIAPHRMFVREGNLTKICRKSQKRYIFFLFTDILLYASSTLQAGRVAFHRMIQLETCRLEDIPDGVTNFSNAFHIIGSQKSFVVLADTVELKVDWLLDLTSIINKLKEKRQTLRRGQSPFLDEVISEAPVWVPDQAAAKCTVCGCSFNVMRRRHHCRACGALVCKRCSSQKLLLSTIDAKKRVRVCDLCHTNLTAQQEEFAQYRRSFVEEQDPEVMQKKLEKIQSAQIPTKEKPANSPQIGRRQTEINGEQPILKQNSSQLPSSPQVSAPNSANSTPQGSPQISKQPSTAQIDKQPTPTQPEKQPVSKQPATKQPSSAQLSSAPSSPSPSSAKASPSTPRANPTSTPPNGRPPVPAREPSKIKV